MVICHADFSAISVFQAKLSLPQRQKMPGTVAVASTIVGLASTVFSALLIVTFALQRELRTLSFTRIFFMSIRRVCFVFPFV